MTAAALPADQPDPAHNWPAEQAVLGSLLVNNALADEVRTIIDEQHFADPAHRSLFAAILQLIDNGAVASGLTLRQWATAQGVAGVDAGYLAGLAGVSVPRPEALDLARIVRRDWLLRTVQGKATELLEVVRSDDGVGNLESKVRPILTAIEDAQDGASPGGLQPVAVFVKEAIEQAVRAFNRGGDVRLAGLSTGFAKLDAIVGGLAPGNLLIIAGRPSMGKTALATGIACAVARRADVDGLVAFFNLEMAGAELGNRIVAESAGVDSSRLRRGAVNAGEMDAAIEAERELAALGLHIDDAPALSMGQIAARARRLKRQRGLSMIVVDYLQLVGSDGQRRAENRTQEVSLISRALKSLAKELDVPVLALSQLSRDVEKRVGNKAKPEDYRPRLSDLRDSGSIEQDADVVMFVHRSDYYAEREAKADAGVHQMFVPTGIAEVIVAKNRHGPTDTAALRFDGKLTRFSDAGAA